MDRDIDSYRAGPMSLTESRLATRILVLEDDRSQRLTLEATLGAHGFEVESAANGLDALRIACRPGGPRVLLLDVSTPGLDGIEVCKRLRANPPEDGYRYVILVTGRDARADRLAGLAAGADDYVTKPADLEHVSTGHRVIRARVAWLHGRARVHLRDPGVGFHAKSTHAVRGRGLALMDAAFLSVRFSRRGNAVLLTLRSKESIA